MVLFLYPYLGAESFNFFSNTSKNKQLNYWASCCIAASRLPHPKDFTNWSGETDFYEVPRLKNNSCNVAGNFVYSWIYASYTRFLKIIMFFTEKQEYDIKFVSKSSYNKYYLDL
jgi:hypothetical protein